MSLDASWLSPDVAMPSEFVEVSQVTAMGGQDLPCKGTFLKMERLISILGDDGNEPHIRIPVGIKEEQFYIIENSRNVQRRKNKQKCLYSDDCGAWVSGASNTSLLLKSLSNEYIEVYLRGGVYGVNKRKSENRVRKSTFEPLEPQPHISEIIEVHRAYSKHAMSHQYKRRISWMIQSGTSLPHIAVVEYIGTFPESDTRSNETSLKSEYIWMSGKVMNNIKRQGRKRTKKRQAGEEVAIKTNAKKASRSSGHQISSSTPEDVFKSLLQGSNLSPSEFFAEYWEQKPLIIARQQRETTYQYSQYFSLDILKRILNENDLKFVEDLSVCRYVEGNREDLNGKGVVKVKKLQSIISKKNATVQFHQPQRFQDSLWKICSSLECYFQCLVGANVYITPGGSQGLAPHYDDVEVFILQLEGEKHWRLYELPEEDRLPRTYSKDLDPTSLGNPIHDFVLKAGDLMYFPRGTIHQADTPKHCPHSTHITISTYQHNTWGDLFMQSLPSVVDRVMNQQKALRTGLPITPGQPFNVAKHKEHITFLMKLLADGFSDNSALHDMKIDFIANRLPPYHSTPEDIASSGAIPTMDDSVRLRFPEYISIVEMTDEDNDDEEEEEDGKMHVCLYHSLHNNRIQHMMIIDDAQPTGLKFPYDHLEALQQLQQADRDVGVAVNCLELSESNNLSLLVSLWSEGLLEVI